MLSLVEHVKCLITLMLCVFIDIELTDAHPTILIMFKHVEYILKRAFPCLFGGFFW